MLNAFIRENKVVSWFLMVVRIYLGWIWLETGWNKIVNGFDATGFLNNAINNPVLDKATGGAMYPTFNAFLENFALPNVKLINILIPWGEFLVGLGLILGCLTTAAAFFGLLMNFMFVFAGTVSSNPWLMLLGLIIFFAGANAGRIGADYYVLPFFKKFLKRKNKELAMDT